MADFLHVLSAERHFRCAMNGNTEWPCDSWLHSP
jgi:hypothetical protein